MKYKYQCYLVYPATLSFLLLEEFELGLLVEKKLSQLRIRPFLDGFSAGHFCCVCVGGRKY
jgi:hypothetical protein